MLIIVSPAKSLDYTSALPTGRYSQPRMLDEAESLVQAMRRKSPDDLISMMGISPGLAELNCQRFADWATPFAPPAARPALLAFSGDVYRSMDAPATFGQRDYTHAQKVLRILSGLYGMLRPLDLILPYRLEMGARLVTERGRSLYEYWGERITDALNDDLRPSPGTRAVVDLASKEYRRAVDIRSLDGPLISPVFLDGKNSGDGGVREPRVLGFCAKRARGAMASWIIRNRVKTIRGLRDFGGLGYAFDTERSTASDPVFVRWS